MRLTAVVYDPDHALPPTFASDEGFGDDVALVSELADARRVGRLADALVIVGGRDEAGMIGLIASSGEPNGQALVLFLPDAEHGRRIMICGARLGAAVLVGQPPAALAACLHELVALLRFGANTATTYRPGGSAISTMELCLLLVALQRGGVPRRRTTS